ncbi:MAG: hypothetical protein ACI9B9_001353 [Halioglobus sp.]|jgi:hypothetical protein
MTAFLVITFIVALALAPLAHFVPTKYQRRIAGLREYAALQGLFVEFRSPPLSVPSAAERYRPGSTLYYGLRLPINRRKEPPDQVWVRREQEWRPSAGRAASPAQLAALPDDVFAVGIDSYSCGIYWQEGGEQAEIDEISDVLKGLVKELTS